MLCLPAGLENTLSDCEISAIEGIMFVSRSFSVIGFVPDTLDFTLNDAQSEDFLHYLETKAQLAVAVS